MCKRLLTLIISGVCLLCACSQPEVDYFGSISGLVKDSKSNQLLSGVKVTISPGGKSQMTSTDGTFHFEELEPAEYTISFSKDGYESDSQKIKVNPGADASVQIVLMQIPETKGNIVGIVKDAQNGSLLGGVKVSVSPGGTSLVTEDDGYFRFDKLEEQDYILGFSKDGYEIVNQQVKVKASTDVSVQVVMLPIQPKLSVSTNALSFTDQTSSLSIDITNSGKGTLEWEINEEIDWIECKPTSGKTSNQTSSVVVNIIKDKLDQGNYTDSFVISSNGGSETVIVSTSVNNIALEVEPAELDFGTIVTSIGMTLTNTAGGTLAYEASATNNWITLNKTSGNITKTDHITAVISREGLSAGKYDGNIIFSTKNGSISIPVKMEVAVNEKPTVTVENSSDITYNSALLHGTIVSAGSDKITRYGFCWSETDNPTLSDYYSNLGDSSEPKAFESLINNLKSETKYYFRAYAENNVGLTYSEKTLSFTTAGLPMVPSVITGAVSDITNDSAKAKGNITSLGNVAKILNHGHVWAKASEPTIEIGNKTELGEASETASFSSSITGLEAATTYYIRAYATNEKGTAYGEEISFKTSTASPVIRTGEVTDIIHNAATCFGMIVSTGGNEITEKGICWATDAQPTASGSHVISSDNGSEYKCRITGLSNKTKYYARAYIRTASNDLFYGNDVSFTTTEEVSLASLKEVAINNITTTSASFECAILSDGNSKITDCGFCWTDISEPTVSDNISKCDPESQTMGKTINTLKEGTKYYVRAYATNAMGTAYSPTLEFSTLAVTKPVVGQLEINNIGRTSAYVSAAVSDSGNSPVTDAGFCWSTASNPTTFDNRISVSSTDSDNFGKMNVKLTGLPEKTMIYVRAFATNSKGTGYSENISFMTADTDTDIWDGSIADRFSSGTGTESDPIIISSAAQLALLASRVNGGTTFSGVYFKLTCAISLGNLQWTPIGSGSNTPFLGTFDGNNLQINNLDTSSGLFGYNKGVIKNLTVKGRASNQNGDAGGICKNNDGAIYSCISYVDVSSGNASGGICASSQGTMTDCRNYGNITGGTYSGGIVGNYTCSNLGRISLCANYGKIKGTEAGGVAGHFELESRCNDLFSCSNSGTIEGSSCAGGIIGYASITNPGDPWRESNDVVLKICNCVNCGNLTALPSSCIGGICGFIDLYGSSYRNSKSRWSICNVVNCCNNSTNGLIGHYSRDYYNTNSDYKVAVSLDYSDSYWLYDIVNNIGQENAVGTEKISGSYFTRSSNNCYIKGDTSEDVVNVLNSWVSKNNGYAGWKYENIEGYACPVLDL